MKTILVCGITRSGLTATMQMLEAGGYPCVGEYPGFEVYMPGCIPWEEHKGKAIKVVDTHRQFPTEGEYHVIRLNRNKSQQAKSLVKFLKHLKFPIGVSDREAARELESSLEPDYRKIDAWVQKQASSIQIEFEDIVLTPMITAKKIQDFVGVQLDLQKMADVVIVRSTDCHKDMLEFTPLMKPKR